MIVKLWHDQIVLGKKAFVDVPAKLKELVAQALRESGHEDLVVE